MRAAILTVGDEVTSGQILNRNSAWLANELENKKLTVSTHLTVQDLEDQIIAALQFLESKADLIFITGGLGPTRDDLTRHAVAKWLDKGLVFDEPSWDKICERLNQYGIPVAESNRQQCYFPEGAKILANRAGTANAFFASHDTHQVKAWCLPGPPLEIKRIWDDEISSQLDRDILQDVSGNVLMRWHCLGKSESALGEIVEEAIQGSSLTSGYRPHIPYVEVKLWSPENEMQQNMKFIETMEDAISPWLICRDDENIIHDFLSELERFEEVRVMDFSSQGYLAQKFGSITRKVSALSLAHLTVISEWESDYEEKGIVASAMELADSETLTLALGPLDENGRWDVGWAIHGDINVVSLDLPNRFIKIGSDRILNFQTEKTIYQWLEALLTQEHDLSYN